MADNSVSPHYNMEAKARKIYNRRANESTDNLVKFVQKHLPATVLVTYFDEADELQSLFWVLLRLLSNQPERTAMWYVFMATKSSVSYFNPITAKSEFF
jgi:hypothetical protein